VTDDRDRAGRDRDQAGRDRDAAGRPRNARPRDGLGRPLSRASDDDGTSPGGGGGAGSGGGPGGSAASGAGVEARIPDDLVLDGPEAAALADQLLGWGRPFHAHEVLEASWKTGPATERDLWQGLAQIAVGLTHAHRGNARGAVTLLRRGTQRVRSFQDQEPDPGQPYGMDLAGFAAAAGALADRIETGGLAGITAADLQPRLLAADH
jgi:hypothetical protein